MKTRTYLISFLFFAVTVGVAETTLKDDSLQVSVFTVKATPGSSGKAGSGKADVQEGDSLTGIDFTYDCSLSFLAFGLDRPYPGSWKEKGKVLTLNMTKVGDAQSKAECTLKVTVLPTLYIEKDGLLTSVSEHEFREIRERQEKNEREAEIQRRNQPMPLKVSIVESNWASQGKLRTGSGKGNVTEKGGTMGFLFIAHCADKALQKTSSSGYIGRWEDGRNKLVIAAPAPGDAETPTCELAIETRGVVYVKSADGKITEVPVAEYNKSKSARKSADKK